MAAEKQAANPETAKRRTESYADSTAEWTRQPHQRNIEPSKTASIPFNITESNHIEFSYRLAKPAGTLCTSFCLCYRHDACAARRFGGGKLPAGRGRFRTIYEFLGGRPLRPDMAGNYVLADRAGRLYALPNVTLTVSEIRISFSLIFALFRYL